MRFGASTGGTKNIDVRVDADSESILVYQDQSKVQANPNQSVVQCH